MRSISHTMATLRHGFTLIGLLFQPWTSSDTFGRALLLAFATVSFASAQSTDVLTYHNDNAKTGQQLHEEILTPANVTAAKFGKLWVLNVDGKVDAHGERAINFCRIEKRDASVHGGTQKRNHFLTISRCAAPMCIGACPSWEPGKRLRTVAGAFR